MEPQEANHCKHVGKRLFICISEECTESDKLACELCMCSPPHYHSQARLRNLTTQQSEMCAFIPLIDKKRRMHEMIIDQGKQERARLIRQLEMRQNNRLAKLEEILPKEIEALVTEHHKKEGVEKGGNFNHKYRPAHQVSQNLDRYYQSLQNKSNEQINGNSHASRHIMLSEETSNFSNKQPDLINATLSMSQQMVTLKPPSVVHNINGNGNSHQAVETEQIKVETSRSAVTVPPRPVRLPTNIIRTKPREYTTEPALDPPSFKPNVIEIEDDIAGEMNKNTSNIAEKFWNNETPNPEVISMSPQQAFSKLEDKKFMSFKTAADYLNINTYHEEIQITISPFSFETPEQFKKLALGLSRLKELRTLSLTIKPNWNMNNDSAQLLEKQLDSMPKLDLIRLQFKPSRNDISHYKFPLLAKKLNNRFFLVNNLSG